MCSEPLSDGQEPALEGTGHGPAVRALALGISSENCQALVELLGGTTDSGSVEIIEVDDLALAKQILEQSPHDLVILELTTLGAREREFVHWTRLMDAEPAVLTVLEDGDPRLLGELYAIGCHKCIEKDGLWIEELARAARHVLRLRRLEEENRRLLSRITEANRLLEEKNRRLDEFSATLAHDIRGPLAGIGMKVEYILDRFGPEFPERSVTLLRSSLQATHRLIGLVQAMYDHAKLGARAAKMSHVPLKGLITDVIGDLNVQATREIEIGIDELPTVWGAEELLRRVFLNLISNAVKYNDKPVVVVNIGCGGYKVTPLSRFAEIYVEDNGPGIADDERERIFSFFHRIGGPSAGTEGMGVGLAVVQRIVELHFGTIEVSAVPRQGTRFSLWLPTEEIRIGGL